MNENKIKTYCSYSFVGFVLAFVVLCCLPLTSYAATSGSSISEFPVPYGSNNNYLTTSDFDWNCVDASISWLRNNWNGDAANRVTFVVLYEVGSNYYDLLLLPDWGFSYNPGNTPLSLTNTWTYYKGGSFGVFPVRYYLDGHCDFGNGGVGTGSLGGYLSTSPSGGSVLLPNSQNVFMAPLYYSGGDIIFSSGGIDYPIFTLAGSSGGDDESSLGSGHIIGSVTDYDGRGFDYDLSVFVDMNPLQILGEEIRDGIGSLIEKVEDGFEIVVGSIGDTFTMLQNNTQTLISKVQELASDFSRPTSEQIADALQDSEAIGGMVSVHNKIKGIIDTLTTAGIEVPDAEDMEFDIPFHWQNYFYQPGVSDGWVDHTTTVHISFSWYESIRSKVLIVIYTFMAIGFAIYLFKQIPAILQGMAGSYSAGKSVSDVTANSGTDSYGYKNGVKIK